MPWEYIDDIALDPPKLVILGRNGPLLKFEAVTIPNLVVAWKMMKKLYHSG